MPPMDRKPPRAVSPRRLRPRHNLRSAPIDQTPTASIRPKTKIPIQSSLPCDLWISSELMEMAKRVTDEFEEHHDLGTNQNPTVDYKTRPVFERGRFYELYSARRNQRLMRKKLEIELDETVAQDPGIAVELAKKRNLKKAESVRKSVPANFSVSRGSSLRSSLRSSKEIRKFDALESCKKPVAAGDLGKRIGTRSVRRI